MTDQPLTEVTIDTAGPTIIIKSAEDLATVQAAAMSMFREAMELYPLPRPVGDVGFVNADRSAGPEYVSAHQVDLRSGS